MGKRDKCESAFERDLRAIRRSARTYTPVFGRSTGIRSPRPIKPRTSGQADSKN